MNITVVGSGYVGLSAAVMLAQKHTVTAVDILPARVEQINSRSVPVSEPFLRAFWSNSTLKLTATLDACSAYEAADFILIAVPTDYDETTGQFDTSAVEQVIEDVNRCGSQAVLVVRSTVPMGFTVQMRRRGQRILFCPEFLRENQAFYDCLHPSRIVIGTDLADPNLSQAAQTFAELLQDCARKELIETVSTGYWEAESIKLFSNTYLAMRVSFFNELDTYAEIKGLDVAAVIRGVCLDPRIGDHYNNPSFGYGGYCLPKDSKQLLANYADVPQTLMHAIVTSNQTRKDFIAGQVLSMLSSHGSPVGIYRLTMKSGSDNFRQSSILDVMARLQELQIPMLIYEPCLPDGSSFQSCPVTHDLKHFKTNCGLILANRFDPCLSDAAHKVYTRDLYARD